MGSALDLTACNDADYADKSNDRRSVSGTVFSLGCAAISWASSTQRCVTLSTAEAEYLALGEGVKEALLRAQGCSLKGVWWTPLCLKEARWPPPRSRQGGPKATRAHLQPPAPTKGTAKIPPRSYRGGQHTSSGTAPT